MARVKSKGTILLQELSMVYTAVAQLTDISLSGNESETYDSTTLDAADAGKTYECTGYTEGGTVDMSGFYDPALAGHQAITDLLTTPADQNWRVTFADSAPTSWDFTGAGVGFDVTVAMADGVKFSSSIKVDGLPTYPT